MSRLTRDGTAEPVSRDQLLRHARGQGSIRFPYSADHVQDWQPYPVDPYSAICDDHTYIPVHTIIDITTIFVTMYYVTVVMLGHDWWLCMVINISVQYNGGFLPDIILLTQGYYHYWGTM